MAALEARGLTFGYTPHNSILNSWSHTFEPGTMTALTGSSGSGKSTSLYLLGLLLSPQSGGVWIDDVNASHASDSQRSWLRAHHFGFVFQNAELDHARSLADNILESCQYRGQDPQSHLERAVALMEQFGVDLPLHRRPVEISGGQAQRIALCRALLSDPTIVLADEPTGNLDERSAEVVVQGLRDHAEKGRTVIISTHSAEVVQRCDIQVSL